MVKENKPAAFSVVFTAVLFVATVTLLVLSGGLCWWCWREDLSTDWNVLRQLMLVCGITWGALFSILVLGFIAFRLLIRDKVIRSSSPVPTTKEKTPYLSLAIEIKTHLRRRYAFFWRYNVRLLLVIGDDTAIAQLVPGLKEKQWLEGNRTILIYGGSLTAQPDSEKYAALRKLRRSRPLDGIVRVIGENHDQWIAIVHSLLR